MKKIIFLIFLTACTSKNVNNNILDFNMDLTFDEFKILLEEYDNSINNWEVLLQSNQCYRAQTNEGDYIVSCSNQQSLKVPDKNITFNI